MIAPDETTFAWLEGRPGAPRRLRRGGRALARAAERLGRPLRPRGRRRRRVARPPGHLGHQPRHGRPGHRPRADARGLRRPGRPRRRAPGARVHGPAGRARRSRTSPSTPSSSAPAPTAACPTCAPRPRSCAGAASPTAMRAMVVPGSMQVKAEAEAEGLDRVFRDAGLRVARRRLLDVPGDERRRPRSRASAAPRRSNRNFEGRQGKGGRTHLVSPPMAAAAAIAGHLVDVRSFDADAVEAVG